ncbi:hypothetical protein CMI44_01515 [Candidatus Pacearchaeota archaeon]|jgi:hypothetical protein|nr:hypothetical protein [Candidatus Pacearchaeota archaeon]|tara:strand:+ start:2152 stop:2433 length:282 start_codon:yes stop_codon:yes gene_type:complete
MEKKLKKFFRVGVRFKREFRRQLRMLITITLGFTIAFTWRQTIFDLSQSFVNFIFHLESLSALSIATSIFITIISIVLIYLASYYLKNSYENY